MKVITCEQVSDGHPDKIADEIADEIVTDCLKHDKSSRVAIEVLLKNEFIVIAGELSSKWNVNFERMVYNVFEKVGPEKLDFENIRLVTMVREQSNEIASVVKKGLAGDQAIVYGYATNETPEMLPIPYVLATDFMKRLKAWDTPVMKADAKSQVGFDYDTGKITSFLCSTQHADDVEPKEFREVITRLMKEVASNRGLNTDFEKFVNPAGRFTIGGSFADCGVTGKKLFCDTYGGVGRVGGSLSGKDPTKVDRSGAYAARKIAKDIVTLGYCDKCEIQIAYGIGLEEPVSMTIDTFGTCHASKDMLESFIGNYDLTPRGIISALDLNNVDYNEVSSYGHFTNSNMPWERTG